MKKIPLRLLFLSILLVISVTFFNTVRSINQSSNRPTAGLETQTVDLATVAAFSIKAGDPKISMPSPFMSLGRPMKYDHVFIKDAAEKYPKITACLSEAKPDDTGLNLLNFRWDDFNTDTEVRLCLFYVADILNSPDRMKEWFEAQGMPTYTFRMSVANKPPLTAMTLTGRSLEYDSGSCSLYNIFVSLLYEASPLRSAWKVRKSAYGFQISYLIDDRIAGVKVEPGSCFN